MCLLVVLKSNVNLQERQLETETGSPSLKQWQQISMNTFRLILVKVPFPYPYNFPYQIIYK